MPFGTSSHQLKYAYEIETTHTVRMINIFQNLRQNDNNIQYSNSKDICKKGHNYLYSNKDVFREKLVSIEVCKYVTRVLYVPDCCRDIDWLLHSAVFNSFLEQKANSSNEPHLADEPISFRLVASPKNLETHLVDVLLDFEDEKYPCNPRFKCNPTKYSHGKIYLFFQITHLLHSCFTYF